MSYVISTALQDDWFLSNWERICYSKKDISTLENPLTPSVQLTVYYIIITHQVIWFGQN